MSPSDLSTTAATTLAEANARIEALWDVVDSLTTQAERLQAENETLREQLTQRGRSSRTSSKPPSSDSPAQKADRPKKPRSTRRQGAQPGHDRHERPLVPEADVDEVHRYFPNARCGCGGAVQVDVEPHCRHQVFDLPRVTHTVAEHQLFGGCCGECGARHAAEAPSSVPSGQMGPTLIAWIALMSGEFHLSVRRIQRLLVEQWGLSFSVGAISEAQGKANAALLVPYEAIRDSVRAAPVAHADETRHPIGAQRESKCSWWMWVLSSAQASFFRANCTRGKLGAKELLGDFEGVLVTDDYGGYADVPAERRQLCWAHVLRHFAAIAERPGTSGEIGRVLLLIGRAVIRTRHRLDQGGIEEHEYLRRMKRLRRRLVAEFERGAERLPDTRTGNQCRHLLGREPMLWTFLGDRRVPLTNNLAERNLRPYVIWRKVAHASQSGRGDRFRAMVLSVVMTGRQLGVPVYEYLCRICEESLSPEGVTTLLPLDTPRLPSAG